MLEFRNAARALAYAVLFAGIAAVAPAAGTADAVLYRIFLRDGTTVVSYGEFARVEGRVVLSIPLAGLEADSPELQLVSLPESVVDWERTERYAEAARAKRFAEAFGEAEFSRLSEQVAELLNRVAFTKDPARRLALADSARRLLAEWPARNYGYRAHDVSQLSSLLDEVVSELRVAAGQSRFDLAFVANTSLPPPVPLLEAPDLPEQMQQALIVARLTPEPTERLSLLEAIVRSLQRVRAEPWGAAMHGRAAAELAAELQTEKAYANLTAKTLAAADERARRAEVKAIEALVRSVLRADDKMGRKRPQTTAALLATLDARLDEARRLRLARDAWASRQEALGGYQRRIRGTIQQFRRSTGGLEEIRDLAGPSPTALDQLASRAGAGLRDLALVRPPPGTEAVHAMLTSALQMASRAAVARQTAIHTTNMETAWHASSAAAGALLMFERALSELQRLATQPGQ